MYTINISVVRGRSYTKLSQHEIFQIYGRSNVGLPRGCQILKKIHGATVAVSPGQIPVAKIYHSKSVRDLSNGLYAFNRQSGP